MNTKNARHSRFLPAGWSCAPALVALLGLFLGADAASSATLIVLNKSDNTASLLDASSGKVLSTVPTGAGPHEVAVSPDGKTAVVSDYGTQDEPGKTLTVIDVAARKTLKTIDLGEYRRPHGIAWLEGDQVAVTTEGSKSLVIVDVKAGKVLRAIPTDQDVSHMVALAPKHGRAFVANIGSGSVTVIDLERGRRVANIETGKGAEGIAVSPDQREVWVTNREANTVSILDAASLEVAATLESKAFPIRVKFTPDGKHALVSNARSGDVAVFDTATRREVQRVPMNVEAKKDATGAVRLFGKQFGQSPVPVGILVVPELQRAFVANTNADIISVIDLETWQIIDRLSAGKEPDGLGYSNL